MADTGILTNHMKSSAPEWYMYITCLGMTICSDDIHWSGITQTNDIVTKLELITEFDVFTQLFEVSIERLQWLSYANRES